MSDVQVLQPLKTWSHLAGRRRKPSEYEVVTCNLLYNTRPGADAYELSPDTFMNGWYRDHRDASPVQHADWNAFRDPDELVYRTYTAMQDGRENYVFNLFDQFSDRGHDRSLGPAWVVTLAAVYTPARYAFHTLQMASAYVQQMSPASTITNCAAFQAADSMRWLSHTAYRTKELSLTHDAAGFGTGEREQWESGNAWQGIRELMERVLTTWDWAEAFVALNLVAKPAIEAAVLGALGRCAEHHGDQLLSLLSAAQLVDAERHRKWSAALAAMMCSGDDAQSAANRETIKAWIESWQTIADRAVLTYCSALPGGDSLAADALARSHSHAEAVLEHR